MLKATKIDAISLPLENGDDAVLVQDGAEWNGMRKFKCVAPAQHVGEIVIASPDRDGSPMAAAFGRVFELGLAERMVLVMASPGLTVRLKR